eukprot:366315-Chlamydomonas_euryale.AAC.7
MSSGKSSEQASRTQEALPAGESLNHFLGDNTIPEGMRAPNVSWLRAVRRRPPPTGARANRHE